MDYRKQIQKEIAKLHTANGMKANPILDSDLGAAIVSDICKKAVKEICNLPVVSPSNLTIKCLPFAVKELESEYYLEQYDINKDTIISINSLPDNDEDVLVYYWG